VTDRPAGRAKGAPSYDAAEGAGAPWLAIAALIVTWFVLDVLVQTARGYVLTSWQISEPRTIVATRALLNAGALWVALAASKLILSARGQTFADVGWRQPASTRSWLLAFGLAVLYVGAIGTTIGRDVGLLSDWSVYRISLAIILGVSAGVCGELIFRGFLMAQARDAGLGVVPQVIVSSVLFGFALARFGWSGTTDPNIGAIVAVTGATAVLGAAFAGIYLAAGRSLMPAIVAHTMIDMALQPGILLAVSRG
jgi:uncharacterized protein